MARKAVEVSKDDKWGQSVAKTMAFIKWATEWLVNDIQAVYLHCFALVNLTVISSWREATVKTSL